MSNQISPGDTHTIWAPNRPSGVRGISGKILALQPPRPRFCLVKQTSVTGDVLVEFGQFSTPTTQSTCFGSEKNGRQSCHRRVLRGDCASAGSTVTERDGRKEGCARARTTVLVMLVYWQQGTGIDVNGKEHALDPEHQQVSASPNNAPNKTTLPHHAVACPKQYALHLGGLVYDSEGPPCVLPSSFGSRSHLRQLTTFCRRRLCMT
jgi:hypothetical protein